MTKELWFDSSLLHSVHKDPLYRVKGAVFLRVKCVGCEVHNSPPSIAVVKNA
jgi:hypothetical protein